MRRPDLIVGRPSAPVYYRWQLFKIRGFQLCLHKWLRSDDDRALHDHSGDSISFILSRAGYWEHTGGSIYWRRRWRPVFRKAEVPHRITIHALLGPVWSLWFRWPPRREWGFHCPKGWRHWKDFLASREDYYRTGISEVGPGCD